MGLTRSQQTIWERAVALGGGGQAVQLTEVACAYLIGTIVHDLTLRSWFPEVPESLPPFFGDVRLASLSLEGIDARALFERLVVIEPDADTYFACLATLHKSRLKYESILASQPIPTFEQVGPRGLLQFGRMPSASLTAFLLWRKWFYDIDNRAGQETGYLFEPLIAYSVGGTPVPASKSPIKRHRDKRKRRQVDCLLAKRAYELKMRVTIAASGQGRWREELDFPIDCRKSGYTPVLVVFDPTPNPKLTELSERFTAQRGQVYVGEAAWDHLSGLAGPTMSRFLSTYVHQPLARLLDEVPRELPELRASASENEIRIGVGGDELVIERVPGVVEDGDEMPEDVDCELPGS